MNLLSRITSPRPTPERAGLVELFPTWATQTTESTPANFESLVEYAFKRNGPVLAAIQARSRLFSEVRFVWRRRRDRETFTTDALDILERPWPGATTGELLKRMEQDASLAGNAYIYRASPTRLQRLRPDKVEVMSNGREVMGYLYYPDGKGNGPVRGLTRDEVAHYSPLPDPHHNFVGWSWVQTVLTEIGTDKRMTGHQDQFYKNAATPNLFVKIEGQLTDDSRKKLRQEFDRRFGGWENAYKTVILDGGADLRAVGVDFQQSDFVATKAANENRIAQASGVPAVILGLQSGLENATYSNYEQALKSFAITLRDLWRESAAALATIVDVPGNAELWWDESEVLALQDAAQNIATVKQTDAATLASLIAAGFTPESANKAVITGDFKTLEHTGLFSVQLQEPGAEEPEPEPEPVPLPEEPTDE